MASGRNAWTRRALLIIAITLYALMLAADMVPNPFPGIWEWVSRDRPLAPDLAWQERLPDRPDAAVVVGDRVAVHAGDRVQLHDLETGRPLSTGDPPGWEAEWLAVAGTGDDAVLVTSPRMNHGYEVRDPATGSLLHEEEDAVAVWTYRDARLDLRCDARRACELRSFQPGGGTPEWTADLPGHREGMLGSNPALAGGRPADPNRIDGAAAGPAPVPRLIGLTVERRSGPAVVAVETTTGAVRQVLEPGEREKVMVVGGRAVRSVAEQHNGICVSSVGGHDPVTGALVWGPEPYQVWDTAACEQRTPPLSAGAAMAVVGHDGRPLVLDAYDGRVLWRGEPDESVAALSEELAVVRSAEAGTLYGVTLGGGGEPLWEHTAEPDAEVLVAGCGVIVADRDPSRVYVWDARSGEIKLSVPTTATVLACSPAGVVLAGGRSIGFARFDGTGGGTVPEPPRDSQEPLDSK